MNAIIGIFYLKDLWWKTMLTEEKIAKDTVIYNTLQWDILDSWIVKITVYDV